MLKPEDFFRELRRRRVFRATALYVVGAWVVLQAADLAFPGLRIPESAIGYVWIGAIIGFPIALVLGWRFDLIGGRIKHTPDDAADGGLAPSRADIAILTLLIAVVIAVSYLLIVQILQTRTMSDGRIATTNIDPKSIAVLPFENMSGVASNDPFTVGIHDDVLTHISKISDIKVISRTSVARLEAGMSVPRIGQLLGVATVLEGGVQRVGDRLRFNVQLIDAATDQHLWAETFDRQLTTQNIFEIQSEIAAAITDKLRAALSPRDRVNLGKKQTQNLEAYEAYLLGKQRMTIRTNAGLLQALAYFEKATELDPDYALAYVGLADSNLLLNQNHYGTLSAKESASRAETPIARALALDDQLGAAYASLGLSRIRLGDLDGAEIAFKRAIELDPNYATPYHWYGDMLLNTRGQLELALPLLEKARQLDPLSPAINVTLGEVLDGLGRFDEALGLYQKTTEIEPDYPAAYFVIALHHRFVLGELDEAVRWHHLELSADPTRDPSLLGMTYLDLGDVELAEYWVERGFRAFSEGYWSHTGRALLYRYRGEEEEALQIARQMQAIWPGNNTSLFTLVTFGRYQEVIDEFAPLYPELACTTEQRVTRSNFSQAINLSLAWEETGNKACSERLLGRTLELFQTMPRLGPRGFGVADVEVLARLGQTRLALDRLREAVDQRFRNAWWAQGPGSPHMTSLLEDPEFLEMMDEIRTDLAQQLERVREMDANDELAPVPDPPVD